MYAMWRAVDAGSPVIPTTPPLRGHLCLCGVPAPGDAVPLHLPLWPRMLLPTVRHQPLVEAKKARRHRPHGFEPLEPCGPGGRGPVVSLLVVPVAVLRSAPVAGMALQRAGNGGAQTGQIRVKPG